MTAPTVAVTDRPPLRLLPAPAADPPYDDEVTGPPVTEGALVLAFPVRTTVALRLVPPAAAAPAGATGSGSLPEPRRWTARLAQVIAEVLAGARPAGQLSAYASLDVLDRLDRAAGRLQRRGTPTLRPLVRSVHTSEPTAGAVEACAVIDTGVRRRAMAFRLEAHGNRWQCTSLELG